jgi:hypothetical protein
MKVKRGQEVYVGKIDATDIIGMVPGGLGKVVDIEFRRCVYRKDTVLISIEEVPGVQYTWTNHLEKHQDTLKKMYGKQRAGIKKDEPADTNNS